MANGFADGPAQALRDYLVARGAEVETVFHPLTRETEPKHEVASYRDGRLVRQRSTRFPVRPPLSFALDPFVPLRTPRVDVWFGFNCVATTRGLLARRLGRAGRVVHWCVDFVPERFGTGVATHIYDTLDALCARRSDLRVELSVAARDGRNARHQIDPADGAPTIVVPMGAWVQRTPKVSEDAWRRTPCGVPRPSRRTSGC